MVVEDEKLIARNIAKNIELVNPNFKVIGIESNGEDALSFIKRHTPNVIFTDIQMPVMDGIELIKQISEYNKITPSKYILNYRINIAKQLLGDSALSIKIIAIRVGYTDPFHFSKSFKKVTGISPTSYREGLNRSKNI